MNWKNITMKLKNNSKFIYSILTAFIFLLLLYAFLLPHENVGFNQKEVITFNDNWKLVTADQKEIYYSFPDTVDKNLENGFIVSNILPSNLNANFNSFAKYCVFQNITIRIDDKIVYQTNDSYIQARNYDTNPSAYWILFPLPKDYAGKTITMEVTSPYEDYDSSVGTILLGTRTSIIFHIIHLVIAKFILSLAFIVFGVLFITFYIIVYHKTDVSRSFYYISYFMFWTGLWFFAEIGLFQIFASNYVFIYTLSFVSLMMMILSLVKYFLSVNCKSFHRLQNLILVVLYVYIITACLLQLFHICDFYESLYLFHILIIAASFILLISIVSEVMIHKNKSLSYMMYCIFVLAVSGGLELYSFYFHNHTYTGSFLLVGLLLCILFIATKEIKKAVNIIELNQEAKYYKKLATIDFMTGCKNRTAYGEFLDKKQEELSASTFFAAIMCDMNGLKMINDRYGHEMGDRAIIKCGSILKENLTGIGNTYRIGGDEFIAIIEEPVTEEYIEKKLEHINYECLCADHKFDFKFSVASGYAIYHSEIDTSLDEVLRRADENMYYNKKRLKDEG